MSNELLQDLGKLGGDVFKIWRDNAGKLITEMTAEEQELAKRIAQRGAERAIRTIMAREDAFLDGDVDAQLKNLEVGFALDERRVLKESFWQSVEQAISAGFGMLGKLLKR